VSFHSQTHYYTMHARPRQAQVYIGKPYTTGAAPVKYVNLHSSLARFTAWTFEMPLFVSRRIELIALVRLPIAPAPPCDAVDDDPLLPLLLLLELALGVVLDAMLALPESEGTRFASSFQRFMTSSESRSISRSVTSHRLATREGLPSDT